MVDKLLQEAAQEATQQEASDRFGKIRGVIEDMIASDGFGKIRGAIEDMPNARGEG